MRIFTKTQEGMERLRITGVSPNLKNDLKHIAEEYGVTLSSLLKPKLREMVNDYYRDNPHKRPTQPQG